MKIRLLSLPLYVILFVLHSATAQALYMYSYEGNSFNSFTDNTPPAGSYTSADSVTGYFTLNSVLNPSLALTDITGYAGFGFSFSDGRQTVTDMSANLILTSFQIATDSNGDIRGWLIQIGYPATALGDLSANIQTINSGATQQDLGSIRQLLSVSPPSQSNQDLGRVRNDPGSWTVSTDVPEPATLALFGLGLAGLGWSARKKV